MSKRLYLFWQTRKSDLLIDLLLIIVLTATFFNLSNAVAQYRYLSFANSALERASQNDNDFYYTELMSGDFSEEETVRNLERLEQIQQIKAMPGVRAVYCDKSINAVYGSQSFPVYLCPERQQDLYPELNRGSWYNRPVNDDGTINAVVYGTQLWNQPIGSVTEVRNGENILRIKICGMIYPPINIPTFSSVSTNPVSIDLFNEMPCIIVGECEESLRFFTENESFQDFPYCRNFFVSFESDAADAEIQAVKEILYQTGGMTPMTTIRKNSEETLREQFRSIMTLPVFYVVISVAAFFSISLLYIFRQTYAYSVYYLAGFGKKRILFDVALHTAGLILPAAILNLIYVCRYPFWVMKGIVKVNSHALSYFDSFSAALVLLLSLTVLMIATIAAAGVLHKNSPAELWRKSQE